MKRILLVFLMLISLISCSKKDEVISSEVVAPEVATPVIESVESDSIFKEKVIHEFNTLPKSSTGSVFDYNSTANIMGFIYSALQYNDLKKIKNVKIFDYNYERQDFYLLYDKSYTNGLINKSYYGKYGSEDVYLYEFDKEGKVTKCYDGINYEVVYEYPETGKPDCYKQNVYKKGTLTSTVLYQKTDYGYLFETFTPGPGINLTTEVKCYLQEGKLITQEIFYSGELHTLTKRKYDEEGRVTYIMEKDGIKNPPITICERKIAYLDNGIVNTQWYTDSGMKVKGVFQDYDSHNNWHYAEIFHDGRSYFKYKREFEYID